jgi:uncharacterized membrane protein
MNAMLALVICLFVLLLAVGGKQGTGSFAALMLNSIIIMIAVILMAGGFDPLVVGIVAGMLILACTIFLSSGDSEVAGIAFVAALIVLACLVLVVLLSLHLSATAGFGAEDGEDLEGMSTAIGVSFRQLAMAAGLMSTLGAIAEAAIAVAAGIHELDIDSDLPGIMQMGREIIGTAINTLFFGFFGGFCGLFIWFAQLHYPLWQILNNKIFVSEMLDVLFSVLAVILTIPVTIWVARQRAHAARK